MTHVPNASLTLKSVVLAAVAVAASTSTAQTLQMDSTAPNSGTFLFSPSLVGAYGIINATVGAVAPAVTVEGTDTDGSITGTVGATYLAGAAAPVTGVTLDSSNDIVSIDSQGGNFQSAPISSAANGGILIINNLSYNAATNQIYADVSGYGGNTAEYASITGNAQFGSNTYTLATTREAVFSVGGLAYSTDGGATYNPIADPTTFAVPAPGTYMIQASSLFTVGGPGTGTVAQQFIQSLGLKSIGLTTFNGIDTPNSPVWGNDGLGTLTTNLTFTPVPETSTYMAFGLGLTALSLLARRSSSMPAKVPLRQPDRRD